MPRLTFLLRTTPPAYCKQAAAKFDEMMDTAITKIFDWGLNPTSQAILTLPFRLGGCAIRPQLRIWEVAYESSVSAIPLAQCAAMKVKEAEVYKDVVAQLEQVDPSKAVVFRNQGKSHAWMTAWMHGWLMPPEAWNEQMKLRLFSSGLPLGSSWECVCGKRIADASHVFSCQKFSKTPRHDAVKDVLVRCLQDLGVDAVSEPRSRTLEHTQERPDIAFSLHGTRYILDVTVIYEAARDLQDRRKDVPAHRKLSAVEMARERKIGENADWAREQQANFVPVVLGTTGKLEKSCRKWLNTVARKCGRPEWARETIAKLAVRVAEGNAKLVWSLRDEMKCV